MPANTDLSPVSEALLQSPIPALRNLSIEETEAGVVIKGRVPSWYMKQLAQETVKPVLGGRNLFNRVEVIRP